MKPSFLETVMEFNFWERVQILFGYQVLHIVQVDDIVFTKNITVGRNFKPSDKSKAWVWNK